MLKFQIVLIAMLVCCFAFVSCERAGQVLAPATEDMMPGSDSEKMPDPDMTGTDPMMGEEDTGMMGEEDTGMMGEEDTGMMGEEDTGMMGEEDNGGMDDGNGNGATN